MSLIVLVLNSSILRTFLNLHAKKITYLSRRFSVGTAINETQGCERKPRKIILCCQLFCFIV